MYSPNLSTFRNVLLGISLIISAANINISEGAIGADIMSTLKIGRAVCDPAKLNRMTAHMFFGCYDFAPGKEQFVTCQRMVYGQDLSTVKGICNVCRNTGKLSQYAACLGQEFKAAGVDMTDAVTKINKCQAYVLGVD